MRLVNLVSPLLPAILAEPDLDGVNLVFGHAFQVYGALWMQPSTIDAVVFSRFAQDHELLLVLALALAVFEGVDQLSISDGHTFRLEVLDVEDSILREDGRHSSVSFTEVTKRAHSIVLLL